MIHIKGATQVGKTTVCSFTEEELGFNYVSLVDPLMRNAVKNDSAEFLSLHSAPCIIDEIQKAPELFEYLEGVVNENIKKDNKRRLFHFKRFASREKSV